MPICEQPYDACFTTVRETLTVIVSSVYLFYVSFTGLGTTGLDYITSKIRPIFVNSRRNGGK